MNIKIKTLACMLVFNTNVYCAVYTVINTNDSGSGSLREAITLANNSIGADQIVFNIPDTDPNYDAGKGVWNITLLTTLPMITTGSIIIDATTQQLNQGNKNPNGYEIIIKNGTNIDYPFLLVSSNNVIKGFIIQGFNYGIMIYNSTANNNLITQNFIGTNHNATAASPNLYGISIGNNASNNIVSNNVISGNTMAGIAITDALNTIIKNNRIGTDSLATFAIPNNYGIALQNAANNKIGLNIYEANIISGNISAGIVIDGTSSYGNEIRGNKIGTDATAYFSIANGHGIILSSSSSNIIGGNQYIYRNIISGNTGSGIILNGTGTRNNSIKGNFIGATISGVLPLPNYAGITLKSCSNSNIIGGTTAAERNIISGNVEMGVYIEASDSNRIIGNYIGPDSTGLVAFTSGDSLLQANGLELNTVSKCNIIGGYSAQEKNIISGNRVYGMVYYGNCSNNNLIGNYIGVDVTGNNPMPNATGICVDGGSNHNKIVNNILSGNLSYGIFIVTTQTYSNIMIGNIVGLNASGTDTVPNDAGLLLGGGTKYNIIGGNDAEKNIISGNRFGGIEIADNGTSYNTIKGNYIGTDITGNYALPNEYGIGLASHPSKNIIDSNLITGNRHYGILLFEFADSNVIINNRIGLFNNGGVTGNGVAGIVLWGGASKNKIGGINLGNTISGHDSAGIVLKDNHTRYNSISENRIFDNGFMGIDIFPFGVNQNDNGDVDNGPNDMMNFPVIQHAAYNPHSSSFWAYGTVDTQQPEQTKVELFVAKSDTITNHGGSLRFIGSTYCSSDGKWVIFAENVSEGDVITTTATNGNGSTSEFSFNYTTALSVDEIDNNFLINPIPANEYISICSKEKIQKISVYNSKAILIDQMVLTNQQHEIMYDFNEKITNGLYFLVILSLDNKSKVIPFIVVK